jgi:hypothetical protein
MKQTALKQSLKRRKDRVKELDELIKTAQRIEVIQLYSYEQEILKREIAEDEKLLPVDREQIQNAFANGLIRVRVSETIIGSSGVAKDFFNQTYPTHE